VNKIELSENLLHGKKIVIEKKNWVKVTKKLNMIKNWIKVT
jgi:hypothetical protein